MFIDEILNEGANPLLDDKYNIEPTNEGYDNMSVVIMEDIEDTKKLNVALEAVDYIILKESLENKTINEGAGDIAQKIKEHALSAVKKIKEILGKMWAKVKEVYNTLKMKVFSVTSIDKFINVAKKQLSELSDFNGVEVQGFDFSVLKGGEFITDVDKEAKSYVTQCMKKYNEVSGKQTDAKSGADNAVKELSGMVSTEKFKDVILQKIGTTDKKLNEHIYRALRGNAVAKKTIKINSPSNAIKYLEEYKELISFISELEADTNQAYKSSMEEVDKVISLIPKTDNGNKYASVLQNIAKLSKVRDDIVNRITGITITAMKDSKTQAITIVKKCLAQGKSNKKEADKKKSDTKSVNADTDLLSSIMDRI